MTVLNRDHQTHYEQWGELSGRLQVGGGEEQSLRLKSVRDHSYGEYEPDGEVDGRRGRA